jgi:Type IX secretion system protein PorV
MKKLTTIVILLLLVHFSKAQVIIIRESGIPSPAVGGLALPFSDARHAALGDAGVATSTDYADIFYNPAKTAFANSKFGFYGSYPSFYSSQNNNLAKVGAYYKIPNNRGTLSLNYSSFRYGCPPNANCISSPFDWALGANYAKKLSSKFSCGLGLKYIKSVLLPEVTTGVPIHSAETVAADISIFHQSNDTTKMINFNYGVYISNLSGRLNYGGTEENFIPTNLRIGVAPTIKISKNSTFTFAIDANKLMIPTPVYDSKGNLISTKTAIGGILGSFSDAPGGLKEELQEIIWSIGGEYWYKNTLALRVGKYVESENKGGGNYTTYGVGLKIIEKVNIDLAYLSDESNNLSMHKLYATNGNLWRANVTFGIGKSN